MTTSFHEAVKEAAGRIRPFIRETPLEYSQGLSLDLGANVWLKLENWQITGSFKARGALNKVLQIGGDGPANVVTASTGNHAAAVAFAVQQVGGSAIVYLPETVAEGKLKSLKKQTDIQLRMEGVDSVESEEAARRFAESQNLPFVSPYNDPDIVHGQGTIGYEIGNQFASKEDLHAVFVPVGGGGLISGIAGYLKHTLPDAEIVACQPVNSAVMYHSIKEGRVLDMESKATISDGTAGGVEADAITFEFCQEWVDRWELVEEEEILQALKDIFENHQMLVEGSAGLALASLRKKREIYQGKKRGIDLVW